MPAAGSEFARIYEKQLLDALQRDMTNQAALVKAFVNTISFFPLGSLVRTDRDEVGVVVRTNPSEPLHPVIALMGAEQRRIPGEIDTSRRSVSGTYERHVVETLRPPVLLDLNEFLAAS